ncbi:OapC/ArvC family zinc-ribbon domain-containing protein, partial [Natrinema soli]
MPHQCTNCGRTFDDGSKEMLSGCPDCGGNKFQFAPTTAAAAESFDGDATAGSAESVTGVESAGVADSADGSSTADSSTESDSVTTRAAETVRDWMPGRSSDASDPAESSPGTDAVPGVHSSSDTPSESPPGTPSKSPPGDSDTSSKSDKPWPSSERSDTTEPDASAEGEFADWPETARRPEDRSGASSETPDEESVDVEHSTERPDGPTTAPDGP